MCTFSSLSKNVRTIGSQPRDGYYGACIAHRLNLGQEAAAEEAQIAAVVYAARPKSRLWLVRRASDEGASRRAMKEPPRLT